LKKNVILGCLFLTFGDILIGKYDHIPNDCNFGIADSAGTLDLTPVWLAIEPTTISLETKENDPLPFKSLR
jgi:hypothetical protein